MNTRTYMKASIVGALLATPIASQAAFDVDGINTANEYSSFFDVEYFNENNSTNVPDGIGTVGLGYDAATDNIYVLLEVPTNIQDLTYSGFEYKRGTFEDSSRNTVAAGDQNAAAGWYGGPNLDHAAYKKVQGSEKWAFDLDGESVVLKMKDDRNDGTGTGYDLDRNGGNRVTAASTSLDYNMNTAGTGFSIEHSPECDNPIEGGGATDQDCYDDLIANFPDYQFAQRYEIEINNSGNFFALSNDEVQGIFTDLDFFQNNISNSVFHASKPKGAGAHNFEIPCIDGGTCTETQPPCTQTGTCSTGVPVPGTAWLWGVALAALGATRRRSLRKA